MESEHKHARFSVFQIVDSHGFSRRPKNAPMNKIAAAVPWEHGENLLSALRKHVQVCLRQYIWSGSGGGVEIGVGFMCARGASTKVTVHHLQSRRYYHASELWREGHWKFAATLLHILLEQWSFLVCFFWGDSTSQRKLTTNPFVRIPMNEPQWTLASTGRPLGRHHLQRWSGKSLKGRMAKKQLMLEAQFMPLVPRRGTYTKMIHENIRWVGSFIYPNCDL